MKGAAKRGAAGAGVDPLRPADHIDAPDPGDDGSGGRGAGGPGGDGIAQPKLGVVGWLRFGWRQLTSMRTAILLLLLLAIAAVPGSLVPQRSSDPNGVTQYFTENPDLAPVLDKLQMFDVYTSAWFSAVYLLLFVSLIGCIIPRTKHHFEALRARPPRTPARLSRLAGYTERPLPEGVDAETAVAEASKLLKQSGYRVEPYALKARGGAPEPSVSAERGYLRETGNLVFHTAMLGVLVAVGVGGGFGFAGQRVIVEGQAFVNTLSAFDSFNPGRFFDANALTPYKLSLGELDAVYETQNQDALGQPIDFTARVTVTDASGASEQGTVKVNEPLRTHGTDVYLLGNGYAPHVVVRDPEGEVVFDDAVPFLPQDANLTSIGVVKVTDGLDEQLGMVGFFYPTQTTLDTGAFASTYPDLVFPVLTLNVYEGDLGIDGGTPTSVYTLDPSGMQQLTGGETGVDSIELMPGQVTELPGGRGTVEFVDDSEGAAPAVPVDASTEGTAADERDYSHSVKRFASFDIHHDPTQGWVLVFAILILAGLLLSLFVPRRRMWVKVATRRDGSRVLEFAGLARGEDPTLEQAVSALADKLAGPAPSAGAAPADAESPGDSAKPTT
ncbi:cytochrome c biogenesis protein ResB [Agromyces soli]